MRNYRLSQISIQAMLSIPILILTSAVFYSIGKNQVFYSEDILALFIVNRWPYIAGGIAIFFAISFQRSFASGAYWIFIALFFLMGIVDFELSRDKVALAVLFLTIITSTVIGFIFSADTKSAYLRGMVSENDLMMAPKKQIRLNVRKLSDQNDRVVAAFLSNWDESSGFFHLMEHERFNFENIELEIDFGGVKFLTFAKIVKINHKEAGYGFVVDKNLSANAPSWHNFLSLLFDLGLNPELVV